MEGVLFQASFSEDVPFVELMYLVFSRMPIVTTDDSSLLLLGPFPVEHDKLSLRAEIILASDFDIINNPFP